MFHCPVYGRLMSGRNRLKILKNGTSKGKEASLDWGVEYLTNIEVLGRRFVGQRDGLERIAGVMATYLLRRCHPAPPPAPRVLLVGPPSAGKTSLAQYAAKQMNLPTTTVNLGLSTPEGYRGSNPSAGINQLIEQAGIDGKGRIESHGACLIYDEVDKVLRRNDEWTEQLQYATLGVMGGELVPQSSSSYDDTSDLLDTTGVLVFALGVFPGTNPKHWRHMEAACQALLKYGFCEEWVSRLTHVIYLPALDRKEVLEVVRREAHAVGTLYSTNGPGGGPILSPRQVASIARQIHRHPLGLRHARMLLHEAYLGEARRLGTNLVL